MLIAVSWRITGHKGLPHCLPNTPYSYRCEHEPNTLYASPEISTKLPRLYVQRLYRIEEYAQKQIDELYGHAHTCLTIQSHTVMMNIFPACDVT